MTCRLPLPAASGLSETSHSVFRVRQAEAGVAFPPCRLRRPPVQRQRLNCLLLPPHLPCVEQKLTSVFNKLPGFVDAEVVLVLINPNVWCALPGVITHRCGPAPFHRPLPVAHPPP